MFTGLIEEIGVLKSIKKGAHSAVLTIGASEVLKDSKAGDSIAVNGVCLTATSITSSAFTADVMHETLDRSALSTLSSGSKVNLERAMAAGGRFGGHIVSGHIDGVGVVSNITKDDNAIWYHIDADCDIMKYVVLKGSIAIDGISLTVAKVDSTSFAISAIPHSVAHTTLSDRKVGDKVNLETDIIGRYVEKLMTFAQDDTEKDLGITREFLLRNGF
jgi:riboflavin synthase